EMTGNKDAPQPMTMSRNAGASAGQLQQVKEAIATAAVLKAQFKERLEKSSVSSEGIREAVEAARSYREIEKAGVDVNVVGKENADLRGQVAFLKNRLDARGGRDYPPCWADESGKAEFLFAVELRPEGVVISPGWPERRAADANALPGVTEALG